MSVEYGCTRTFNYTTYSVDGMDSSEEALLNVYTRAFYDGNWVPRTLRSHWWQFWLPDEYNWIEKEILYKDRRLNG